MVNDTSALSQSFSEDFDIFRRVVAFSTSESWKRIPHVSYLYEPDVTDFYAFYREKCRIVKLASGESLKITFGTVLLKAVAEALLAAPRLNAFLRYNAFAIRGKLSVQRHVNVTLPWLLADGKVVTVVVPRVEEASIVELQSYINRLAERIGNSNMHEVLNRTATHDTIHKLKTGQMAGFARLVSVLLGLTRFTRLKGKERRKYYARDPSKRLTAKDINAGTVVISNIGSIQDRADGQVRSH